ncbi:MAG: STAS domain-containing protein [Candidatus Thiodiazotropha endolucinida]|uniref:STAS domain protein n=1 Tax=Candidatus Thiodiazotropha endolucinida TaxID=1655433 RepID=A0A7Z0VLZ8_9GAMM|nr:STAS domain-containing protein [Candidatus Thiodiazotropha endolucinida]ODJ88004.1 STAS domain protein [Candidatus Thiodiazotropha endolucinida]
MTITKVERDGAFRFHVQGEMTFSSVKELLLHSKQLFSAVEELEVDLSQVDNADSAGLALVLEWMAQAAERNARIVFTGVPESMVSIARLCQVESLLEECT